MDKSKMMNIKQILDSQRYPFTLSQLRGFLRDRKENGLNEAVLKIGKIIYLNIEKFDKWIDDHSEKII